jgi:3',5'-cyclic-AMP phosphodiesterase
MFRIVQLSDLHCGQQFFLPQHLERAISETNELEPDVVVISGDLTSNGFKDEYVLARDYLNRVECEAMVVIGDRNSVLRVGSATIVAADSSEPDLDNGQIGRGRYRWIEEQFAADADLRVFVLHHHLLPVPGTGRERNIVNDAGDTLETLQRAEVDLVLAGHKHVPYAWKLENLFVVNAGTVSSSRLRGNGRPCYNVVEVDGTHVDVWRRYPFHGQEKIIQFSTETKTYEKYTARIEDEVRST